MKAMTIGAALFLAAAVIQPAMAQDSMASTAQAIVATSPATHVKATIVGIEQTTRTLTLKGPKGNIAVVAVNPEVAGFDNLHLGDHVDVLYKSAVLLAADKVKSDNNGIRERVDTQTYKPGGTGYDAAHRVDLIATVQKIDKKERLVTLRGPNQAQTLQAAPDISLDNVKVGDTVHAVFVSATAVQVTPQGAAAAQPAPQSSGAAAAKPQS